MKKVANFLLVFLVGCLGPNPDYNPLTNPSVTPHGDMSAAAPDAAEGDLAGVVCEVAPQYGCFPGYKCTTRNAMTTQCDPVIVQPMKRGATCLFAAQGDNCEVGTVCVDAGGGNRMCRAFCNVDADCGPNSYCDQALGSFRVCSQPCDPLANAGCPTGFGCYLSGRTAVEKADCFVAGVHPVGDYCKEAQDCIPTAYCGKNTLVARYCTPLCKAGVTQCPSQYPMCAKITYSAVTYPTYGYCN